MDMRARDIMSRPVIAVGPEASVPEVAALLLRERISAVPVLDDGVLVGVVGEACLVHRHEIGTERNASARPWWVRLFAGEQWPAAYVESHAMKVKDIMRRDVISIDADMPLAEVAALFESRGIRRAPVVDGGKVVGVVSLADFVRAFAAAACAAHAQGATSDESIRAALLRELESQPWWRPLSASVVVKDGVVHVSGLLESEQELQATRVAAENVPGVRRVEDHRAIAVVPSWGAW